MIRFLMINPIDSIDNQRFGKALRSKPLWATINEADNAAKPVKDDGLVAVDFGKSTISGIKLSYLRNKIQKINFKKAIIINSGKSECRRLALHSGFTLLLHCFTGIQTGREQTNVVLCRCPPGVK